MRKHREKPSQQSRAAIDRQTGDLAAFASAALDWEAKDYVAASKSLAALRPRLPKLDDYIQFMQSSAAFEQSDYGKAASHADAVLKSTPLSPLFARALSIAAKSLLESGNPKQAAELLRRHHDKLPLAERELLLARCMEALDDGISAAAHYQAVFYRSPSSSEAAQAETELKRLQQSLGDRFPPAMPQLMLERAERLLRTEPSRSRAIYQALVPELAGAERDLARVRIGVADYNAKHNDGAYRYLTSLDGLSAGADAERLYFQHSAARRLKRDDLALQSVEQLARYPHSRWRMEALISAGNDYLLRNEPEISGRMFRACYESFPSESRAPYCHWKVAWDAYLRRSGDAANLLREHAMRWPASDKTPAALYFLGRMAEKAGNLPVAKAYYDAIATYAPNYFHATLARERLSDTSLQAVHPSVDTTSAFKFQKAARIDFTPNAATQVRLERARLLYRAGFDDWAEGELRFAASHDAQAHVVGIEMADRAARRGAHDLGIRWIKAMVSGYLTLPLDAAPEKLWRLAFPMPYRELLESHARAQSIDPFLLAALIRQESEFNPQAVSRARAHGLTQVMPSTGRELSRKLGLGRFSNSMLFEPDVNLKLGTHYLRTLFDSMGGRWEATLASYNGGKSRVVKWLDWAEYEEPAEFIETIPITETRDYVQIILRNADVYRRLYGGKFAATSTHGTTR